MKKRYILSAFLFFLLLFSGCGKTAVFQYQQLVSGTECAIVGIEDRTVTKLVIPEELGGLAVTRIETNAFAECTELEHVELPTTLEVIGIGAFYKCTSLKEISMPEGLKEILGIAFMDCISLKKVEFNEELEVIDTNAFLNCSLLKEIELSDSIVTMGANAFCNCTSLSKVKLPDGIEVIEKSLFKGCTSIEKIEFPESLKSIGETAFENCTSLCEIFIPAQVDAIDKTSFSGCSALKSIKVSENNPVYTSKDINGIEVNAIINSYNVVIMAIADKNLKIPEGAISISNYAYEHMADEIISVEVPPTVSWDCLEALRWRCKNLTTVYGDAGSTAEMWAKGRKLEFIER